jgi:hypothetical protein
MRRLNIRMFKLSSTTRLIAISLSIAAITSLGIAANATPSGLDFFERVQEMFGMKTAPEPSRAGLRSVSEMKATADMLAPAPKPMFAPLAAFTSGNLVVFRADGGGVALAATGTAVFLDEYSTAGGAVVQSVALPTTASGSNKRLVTSGSATSEGLITRSSDGRYLIVAGYDGALGGTVTGTNTNATGRVLGRVDSSTSVDTSTIMGDNSSPGNPRGSTSTNGGDLWLSTSAGGVKYLPFGATSATTTQLSTTPSNTRATKVINGQLYISAASGAFLGIASIGTGTPTTSGQTTTALTGFPTSGTHSSYGFSINPTSTIAYVADDGAVGAGGGIQKWTSSGGTWSLAYTLLNNGTTTTAVRGLTVDWSGANPIIYATTSVASANTLIKVTDSGSGSTATTLATSAANTVFRGVDFVPVTTTFSVSTSTPTDAATGTSTNSTIAVTFNRAALPLSITTNTANTTCSGSLQVSSDNFATCVRMSGAPVASGSNTIFTVTPASALAGSTTYKIRITSVAQDSTGTGVSVVPQFTQGTGFTTAAALSTNADLASITPGSGTLSPAFAAGTQSYTVNVPFSTTSINLAATSADPNASVSVNGNVYFPGGNNSTVSLNQGSNVIPISCKAQDGTTIKTYNVDVVRAAGGANADLAGITPSTGTLSPAFAAGTLSYTVNVPNGTTSINIAATSADSNASVSVNGNIYSPGGNNATVSLNPGSNLVAVDCKGQDGTTIKSYSVDVFVTAAGAEPTIQAANLVYSNVTQNSLDLNWTSGNGTQRIVIGSDNGPVTFVPVDGVTYTPQQQLPGGNIVAYIGNGSSLHADGLPGGTLISAAVYEFNGSAGAENYLTTLPGSPSNPNSTTTPVATYSWNHSTSDDYSVSDNWTPARESSSTSDRLQISNGGAVTLMNVPTETIGQLTLSNNTAALFEAGPGNLLTIAGDTGADLSVPSGSALNIDTGNGLTIAVGPGATGLIGGTMTFSGGPHKLTAADAGGVTFQSGSSFATGTTSSGNPFGNTGTANAIVFSSGSTYLFNGGSNPFGLTAPASIVVFQTGSLYKHQSSNVPSISGRTYANFEYNVAATINSVGAGAFTVDNLTVSQGTFNVNVTGGTNIKGNVSAATGATLAFTPATASAVTFNGPSAQTISGLGAITLGSAANLTISNAAGVTISRDITTNQLTFTNGNITTGANTMTIASGGTVTRTSGHVIGNLRKTYAASGSQTFEVGTANGYSPVTANATAGTFPTPFTVSATQGAYLAPASGLPANRLGRWWTLTNGGGVTSANITFTYLASDVTAGSEVNYSAFRISGGTASQVTSTTNTGQHSTTATGVTSFSDWTTAEVPPNTNPTISDIVNQTMTAGNTLTLPFTVGDAEQAAASLTVGGVSDNQTALPNPSIVFGGSGANRTVSVTPIAAGTATVTVTVNDGAGGSASDQFTITINAATCYPAPAGMVAWYKANNNPLDIFGDDGTEQGGAGYTSGKVGQAFSFNGSTSYVAIPDSPNWDFGTGDFSVDGWINTTDPTVPERLVGAGNIQDGTNNVWTFGYGTHPVWGSGNRLNFAYRLGGGYVDLNSDAVNLTANAWHHIAVVRAGSMMTFYFDGAPAGSSSIGAAVVNGGSSGLTIGARRSNFPSDVIEFANGQQDEIEVFKSALTAGDVSGIYNASSAGKCDSQCTPAPSGMIAWYKGNNNPGDIFGNGATFTANTYATGKVAQAFAFNGTTNRRADITDATPLDRGIGDLSVDLWFNLNSLGGDQTLFSKRSSGGTKSYFLEFGAPNSLRFRVGDDAGTVNDLFVSTSLVTGRWYHVAGVRSGATNKLYLDGVQIGTQTTGTVPDTGAGGIAAIGYCPNCFGSGGRFVDGLIDEVEIFNRTLSTTDIQRIYNAGSAGKCDAQCRPAPGGMTGWWKGNGNAGDVFGNDGTFVANTYAPGEVEQAMHFDGSANSYVSIPDAPSLTPSTNKLTIDAWVRPDFSVANDLDTILMKRAGCSGTVSYQLTVTKQGFVGSYPLGTLTFAVANTGSELASSVVVPNDGRFHHVAGTYDGSVMMVYIDGVQVGQKNFSGAIPVVADPAFIGRHAACGQLAVADIDEVELFNRDLLGSEIAGIYNAGSAGKCDLAGDHLDFQSVPASGTTNVAVSAFTVRALKANNTVDAAYVGNITISKNSGPGVLGGTLTKPAVNGVATFDDITFNAAGTYTLLAASGTLALATSGSIVIANGATAPSVTTDAASVLTPNSATLNGTANPNASAAIGWLRYSASPTATCDDSFGTRAPASGGSSLGAGNSGVTYSQPIGGLLPGTIYYYCAIASNSVGTGLGSIQQFTTPAPVMVTSPGSLTFPATTVGNTSPTQDVTVTNSGTADLHISAYAFSGTNAADYAIANTPLTTIPPAGFTTVKVRFTPGGAGARIADLVISGDDASNPSDTISLSGNGNTATCTTPPGGMVSWWPGENNFADIWGPNNGTEQGTSHSAGKVGLGTNFNGSSYIDVPDNASLNGTTGTWDFWIKTTQAPAGNPAVLMTKADTSSSQNGVTVYMGAAGIIGVQVKGASGGVGTAGPTSVNDGLYHHVAVVFTAGQTVTIYVDGVPGAAQAIPTFTMSSNPLRIAKSLDPFWDAFAGQIDEVEVFNTALTQPQVQAIYDASTAGKCHTSSMQFTSSNYSAAESAGTVGVTLSRTGAHDVSASVDVASVAGGTATGGAACGGTVDHTFVNQNVSFASGETVKAFNVTLCPDAMDENDETFNLALSNASAGSTIGTQGTSVLTILDDDAQPTISITDATVNEGNGVTTTFSFNASLSNPSAFPVTVHYQTANNTATTADGDYVAVPDTVLTITPGNTSVPVAVGNIQVNVNGDTKYEANETFFVNLSNPSNATILDGQALGTITNDDAPPSYSIDDVTMAEGNAGTTGFTFTITKTGTTALQSDVTFYTQDGTATVVDNDYQPIGTPPATAPQGLTCSGACVSFLPGDITKQVTVMVNGDTTPETNETFFLLLDNATNGTIGDGSGLGTITNDDNPGAPTVSFSSSTYKEDESQDAQIVINRTGDLSQPSSVTIARTGGSATGGTACGGTVDYTVSPPFPRTANFPINSGSQTFTIPLCPDLNIDANETLALSLIPVTNSNIGLGAAVLTINDTASQYRQTTAINMTWGTAAFPYPSTLTVAGAPTNGGMRVTLFDVSQDFPDNLDVLLVDPTGKTYLLMSDSGGPTTIDPAAPVTLTFTDNSSFVLPDSDPLTTGAFLPTTYGSGPATSFPGTAPPNSGATTYTEPGSTVSRPANKTLFGRFGLISPNGDWQLYIRDDAGSDPRTNSPTFNTGAIAGGWGLQFLAPTAAGVTVSGRVKTASGEGIRNARVMITDPQGVIRTAITNGFGYYTFYDVNVGAGYVMNVAAKSYSFTPRLLQVFDSLADVDFTPQ